MFGLFFSIFSLVVSSLVRLLACLERGLRLSNSVKTVLAKVSIKSSWFLGAQVPLLRNFLTRNSSNSKCFVVFGDEDGVESSSEVSLQKYRLYLTFLINLSRSLLISPMSARPGVGVKDNPLLRSLRSVGVRLKSDRLITLNSEKQFKLIFISLFTKVFCRLVSSSELLLLRFASRESPFFNILA